LVVAGDLVEHRRAQRPGAVGERPPGPGDVTVETELGIVVGGARGRGRDERDRGSDERPEGPERRRGNAPGPGRERGASEREAAARDGQAASWVRCADEAGSRRGSVGKGAGRWPGNRVVGKPTRGIGPRTMGEAP